MPPTSNVAARAGGAHHADGVTHGVGQLEVAVDEVADLQDKIGSRDHLSTNPSPLLVTVHQSQLTCTRMRAQLMLLMEQRLCSATYSGSENTALIGTSRSSEVPSTA